METDLRILYCNLLIGPQDCGFLIFPLSPPALSWWIRSIGYNERFSAQKSMPSKSVRAQNNRTVPSPTETAPPSPSLKFTAAMGTLDNQKLKRLYALLLECRMLAERAAGMARSLYSCVPGEEAMAAGAIIHLLPEDCVVSSRRDLLCYFVKGEPLADLLRRLRQRETATTARRKPASRTSSASGVNVIAPMPGGSGLAPVIMGSGIARAFQRQKQPLVTLAFSADDVPAQPVWRDTLRIAARERLPIVHIVRCGKPGTRHSVSGPSAEELTTLALSCEMPAITVDSSDAVAIYRVTFEAIRRAREGHGPALILCIPCQWDAEKTAATSVRRQKNKNWKPHDPLLFMKNYLLQKDLWSRDWHRTLVNTFRRKLSGSR